MRTPKGWTGPRELDGRPIEGTFRAHQVPLDAVKAKPEQLALLDLWMRSYMPHELFDQSGRLIQELADLAPTGHRRMGACESLISEAVEYARQHFEDPPDIRDWVWTDA